MSQQFQDSSPFKRNLRFEKIDPLVLEDEDLFEFQSKIFSQSEERKVNGSFESNSIEEENSQLNLDEFDHFLKDSLEISKSQLQNTTNYKKPSKRIQFFEEVEFQFQSSELQEQKIFLFEKFIIELIKHFNPSQVKEQHLCRINKNFSVFNRILNGANKDSLLIYGVSSTGKSMSVEWALKSNKTYQKITVDCLEFDSEVSFILKLNEQLRSFFDIKTTSEIEYDQFSKKSLFAMLEPFIQKSGKKGILIIQNAQFLVKYTVHKVIYNLSQLAANSRKNIKIVLITRSPNFIKSLDRRQKSRLKLIPLQMLKFRESILHVFKERFNSVQKQIFSQRIHFFSNFRERYIPELEKTLRLWLQKVKGLFCQNQAFKLELQKLSKGIENHLHAACWTMASMLHYGRIESKAQEELQRQLIQTYKLQLNESNSLPSKNLLKNSNLDQKIFMSLVYSMLTNQRKPHSFKTILRISYQFKAQKVEKTYNIYLSEINLKKSFFKLIDKKIIYFQEGTQNQQMNREIKVSMNFLDIRDAIVGEANSQDLPYFVKEVLCL